MTRWGAPAPALPSAPPLWQTKAWATLESKAALLGYVLHRTDDGFITVVQSTRPDNVIVLGGVDELRVWLAQKKTEFAAAAADAAARE